MNKINFNATSSEDLVASQNELIAEITSAFGEQIEHQTRPGYRSICLNISMFLPRKGEVLLPYLLSDKNYLLRKAGDDRAVTNFPYILVPGRWTKRRLMQRVDLGLSPRNVICVGSPRIDLLRRLQAQTAERDPNGRIRVVWLPSSSEDEADQGVSLSSFKYISEYSDRLEEICDFKLVPHVSDRKEDKSTVTTELVEADIVIADNDACIYEAWALGKPVIFPRWLSGSAVSEHYKNSAESYIYEKRIGYHADSFEELVGMIQSEPSVGTDVHEFMADYLETYRSGSSAKLVASWIERLADPEQFALERELETDVDSMISGLKPGKLMPKPSAKPRVSIQVLQQALLGGSRALVDDTLNLLRKTEVSAGLNADFMSIEVESLLMRGKVGRVAELAEQWQNDHPALASYYKARLSTLRGDHLESLGHFHAYFARGGKSLSAYRMLISVLRGLGQDEAARKLAFDLMSERPTKEILSLLSEMVRGSPDLSEFKMFVAQKVGAIRKAVGAPALQAAMIAAITNAKDFAAARPLALAALFKALNGDWRWPVTQPIAGWRNDRDLPHWLNSFEGLPRNSLQPSVSHHHAALTDSLRFIQQTNLPVFLSRSTLSNWLNQVGQADTPYEIELGVRSADGIANVVKALAQSGTLELLGGLDKLSNGAYVFKHTSGFLIRLRPYFDTADGDGLVCLGAGIKTRLSNFELVARSQNGMVALVPNSLDQYLDDVRNIDHPQWDGLSLFFGKSFTIENEDELVTSTCEEIIEAVEWGAEERAKSGVSLLLHLGLPEPWFVSSGMGGKLMAPDFLHLMNNARFLLHIGDGLDSAYYVDLWYDYCKAGDPNAILVVWSLPLFNYLKKNRPELHVAYLKNALDAEWLIANSPKLVSVLYISNTGNNLHIKRFNHLTHVFLGHGDSEKVASCHKFFRVYDEVWAAGKAQIDRFRNSGFNYASIRFRIVGRPTLRTLISGDERRYDSFLYLPTWEGNLSEQAYSSVENCEVFLPAVSELTGMDAVVKFHPWVGRRVSRLSEIEPRLKRATLSGQLDLRVVERAVLAADLMKDAAFLVADISSVVSDYLATGRPIFLYVPSGRNLRMASSSVPLESYCYIFKSNAELDELVRQVIVDGNDYLRESRLKSRQYFVDVDRSLKEQFEQEMRNLVDERTAQHHSWAAARPISQKTAYDELPQIIGHRGDKENYPENSIAGFKAMLEMTDISGVELDLHRTSDGELVVLHDAYLERTTDGEGLVSSHSLRDIRKLRLTGSKAKDQANASQGVPTFDEVLEVFGGSDLRIYIELKNDGLGNIYEGMISQVLETIGRSGIEQQCVLTSFSPDALEQVRVLHPTIPLLASVNFRSVEMLGGMAATFRRFDTISGCSLTLDHKLMAALQTQWTEELDFRRFGIWVVNTESGLIKAIQDGHRQIFTDRPEIALNLLRKAQRGRGRTRGKQRQSLESVEPL